MVVSSANRLKSATELTLISIHVLIKRSIIFFVIWMCAITFQATSQLGDLAKLLIIRIAGKFVTRQSY